MSLFSQAEPVSTRLKMYVYGPSGVGKTVTSLSFPSPAVIDAERGTDHYGKFFKFQRINSQDPATLIAAIDELLANPVINGATIKTLVVDPISVINDAIISGHESRMKIKSGNPAYILKPLDYKYIKSQVKQIALKLLSLDMNVIVTAKEKVKYSAEEMMKVIGTEPEGPKDFPYLFDVVLRLSKKGDIFWATVEKDRTNSLPSEFEYSYQTFTKYLGMEGLEREPVVFKQQQNINARSGRTTQVVLTDGTELYTAGISADNLEKMKELVAKIGPEALASKLKEDFLVDSILDLKNDEADLLIKDINAIA